MCPKTKSELYRKEKIIGEEDEEESSFTCSRPGIISWERMTGFSFRLGLH